MPYVTSRWTGILAVMILGIISSPCCSEILVGKIVEIVDTNHVIIEHPNGLQSWVGHTNVFLPETIGLILAFDVEPRKEIKAAYALMSTPKSAHYTVSNTRLTHLIEKTQGRDQKSTHLVFAIFENPDGSSFLTSFESVHPLTPRSIATRYNLETADAFVALDMKSAQGAKPPTGYHRMTLERLDVPIEHGWFRDDTKTAHISFKSSPLLTGNELGKPFDLLIIPKYLALQAEVDFSSPPQIVKGQIMASLPDNRIIVKERHGKEISIQERQASYHDQIGQNYVFFVMPRKTIIKMSQSPSKEGKNVGVLTSLVDIPNSTLKFAQFRTKEGLIAVTLEGNGSLSQKSLGASFILETRDNYFLKEIKPAFEKKGENIYTLIQVNNTLKRSIFTNETGDIVVNHKDIDLSPTQMGQTFDLTLLKEFYAYKARIEAT